MQILHISRIYIISCLFNLQNTNMFLYLQWNKGSYSKFKRWTHTTDQKNKLDGNPGNQRSKQHPNNGVNGIMEHMFSLQKCTIYSIMVIWSNFSSLSIKSHLLLATNYKTNHSHLGYTAVHCTLKKHHSFSYNQS